MGAPKMEALSGSRADRIEGAGATAWKLCLCSLSLSLAAVVLVYFDTFRSMAAIWSRSDTYVHGYFVMPISLYLVWIQREALRRMTPTVDTRAIAPIVLAGVGWLAARLGGILVAEQYFAVATVPLMVWAIAGPSVSRRILFPLCYLLLLVPVGEALIPHMIEYTAAFTVAALRATGVPVLQEGNLLTLPNSQWSVVEACSGLRYLIACVTIGLVFAYLTYRSWTRRALFIALSIVVPIVANWVRAYLIVFIGYSSDMRLAVGVDHLIYGWIFYAFVMAILLWVGARFSDETAPELRETREEPAEVRPSSLYRTVTIACAAILAAAVWPVWAGFAEARASTTPSGIAFAFPESVAEWNHTDNGFPWEPRYVGASFAGMGVYESPDSLVGLHVALYREQRQGAELVSSANALVRPHRDVWRQVSLENRQVSLAGGSLAVQEGILNGPGGDLLVWKWYRISGHRTSSPIWAKVIEATDKLRFREPSSAGVIVFTNLGDEEAARARLGSFVAAGLPTIEAALEELSQ